MTVALICSGKKLNLSTGKMSWMKALYVSALFSPRSTAHGFNSA